MNLFSIKALKLCGFSLSLITISLIGFDCQAQSLTRISIAKGKDCAIYRNQFKGTKTFVMKIKPYDEQLLYFYTTQSNKITKIAVQGVNGKITPQESTGFGITETNQVYPINKTGDYRVSLTAIAPIKNISFCVINNPNGEKP